MKADADAKAEADRVKAEQDAKVAAEQPVVVVANIQAEQAAAEEKSRAEADAKVAKLKADQLAKEEADRLKAEKKAQAQAEIQAKKEAKLAKMKADQEAKAEAARVKAEAIAAKAKAEQDAVAEAEKLKAEQLAKADAEEKARQEAIVQAEAERLKAEEIAQAPMREKAAKFATWKEIGEHLRTQGVHLEMDAKDADNFFHKDPTDKSSFPVKFIDGDVTLTGRVTVKGSFTRNFLKKSLLIKFDKGLTWHGQDRISLDAMATDVTESHQWLAHDLMSRLKMASPEMLFTNLDINGKRIGRYLMVEWIKPAMFERFGLGADGELYNPEDTYYCGNFQPEDMNRLEKCFTRLDGGKDFTRIKQLAKELDETPVERFDAYIDEHFDGDSVVNWLVVNTLTGSEDTYNKNFFLWYSNLTHKWTVVPWDYDMAFGRVADLGLSYPRTIFNSHFQFLHSPESGSPSPLKEKTLKNEKLYKRFQARIKDIFADQPLEENSARGWYNPKNFKQIIEQKRVDAHVAISSEMFPNADKAEFSYLYDSLRFFNEWRYQYLNRLMLVTNVWNSPIWLPFRSFDPVEPRQPDYFTKRQIESLNLLGAGEIKEAGRRVFFSDPMLGIPLAAIDVKSISRPSRLDVQVASQQVPASVPKGMKASECLERSWHINNRTPDSQIKADLEIDYINEGSTRHELGADVKSELGLSIWSKLDGEWLPLTSQINPRSNSFVVTNVVLDTGDYTLVACVDRKQEAIELLKVRSATTDKSKRIDKQLKAQDEVISAKDQAAPVANEVSAVAPPVAVAVQPLGANAQAVAEEKARAEAEAKVAKLKAAQEAKAEAARVKAEKKAKAAADAQAKKDAKAAQLKAEQDAKAEANRVKAEQDAKAAADQQAADAANAQAAQVAAEEKARVDADAKVAKLKADQEAKAEAARVKAEKKAKAAADAQAKKDAKAAQLKAEQDAKAEANRVKAEQDAKAAADQQAADAANAQAAQAAAEEKARIDADAKVAKLKADQEAKAEAARVKAEKKTKAAADAQAKKDAKAAQLKSEQEAKAEADRVKAEQDAKAAAALPVADAANAQAEQAAAEEKARAEADAKVAKLKADQEAKAEAARVKAEKKAKAAADVQAKKDAKAAQLKAEQEAKAEANRVKAEQEAKAVVEQQAVDAANAQAAQVAAEEKVRAEADVRVAKLKADIEAKAAKKAKAAADAQAKIDAKAAQNKPEAAIEAAPVEPKP